MLSVLLKFPRHSDVLQDRASMESLVWRLGSRFCGGNLGAQGNLEDLSQQERRAEEEREVAEGEEETRRSPKPETFITKLNPRKG